MKRTVYASAFFVLSFMTLSAQSWKPVSFTPYRGPVSNVAVALDGKIYITTNSSL